MNLDLTRLQPGMVVKNYSELCALLGIKPITNIQQQLKSISKYVEVEKVEGSRKYIIKQILKQKEYTLEVRASSKSVKQIQGILLHELINAPENKVYYMHRELMSLFAGVNEVFYNDNSLISYALNNCSDNEIRDARINTKQISNFKEIVELNIGSRIRRGLEGIENRKLITVTDGYLIQENSYAEHLADKKEFTVLRSIENYLLDKYKYNSWADVFLQKGEKAEDFISKWNKEIKDFGLNVYKVRVITLNPDVLKDIKDVEYNVETLQKELNSIFIDTLINQKVNNERYNDIKQILCEGLIRTDSELTKDLKGIITAVKNKAK